jgi:hypothetical protein
VVGLAVGVGVVAGGTTVACVVTAEAVADEAGRDTGPCRTAGGCPAEGGGVVATRVSAGTGRGSDSCAELVAGGVDAVAPATAA